MNNNWHWVNSGDLSKGDVICLDYGWGHQSAVELNSLDFLHMKKLEVVYVYAPFRNTTQSFITHDGIERKLPAKHSIWTMRRI